MNHTWIVSIHYFGFTLSLFLFLAFWFKKEQRGQFYFALLMAVITFLIPLGYLHTSGEIVRYYYLSRVGFPLGALVGPLFYLSMKSALDRNFKFTTKHFPIFSVSFFELIYLAPYFLSGKAEKLRYIAEDLQNVHLECYIMSLISFFGNLLFVFAIISFLRKKYEEEKTWFNNLGKRKFRFIKALLIITIPFQFLMISAVIFNPEIINTGFITAVISILVLLIAYMVLYHSQTSRADEPLDGIHRYDKDRMSDSDVSKFGSKIEDYMDREKVYLNPEYSLTLLANFLDLSQNKTSQTINRFFGKSFPDFLNARRVQHAILLMQDARFRDFNLLRIAFESGFNSKSNFNSCFKKETGVTPRAYRKNMVLDFTTGRPR